MQVRNLGQVFSSHKSRSSVRCVTQVQDRQQRGGDRRALSDISQYRGQDTGELYTAMGPGGIGQFVTFYV